MGFVDQCKVFVKAGNGGDGIIAWRREAHVPLGGPAGGNGGNGGSVYFVGDHNETSLERFNHQRKIIAADGEKGDIKNMHGRNAEDVYVKVPLGTMVFLNNQLVADIIENGKAYLIAKGGLGGHGNAYFKSNFNKAPNLYELGEKGEEFHLQLELKEIADVGIVGLPNAGKSTLISKLTNAKPKVGNYPFTTLIPILGIIKNTKILLADLPGLIAGASDGVGLGHHFLKHIERCKILIHLISLNPDDHENGIEQDYETIVQELKKYDQDLLNKQIITVGNKADLPDTEENFKKLNQLTPTIKISAVQEENLDYLITLIKKEVAAIPQPEIPVFEHHDAEKVDKSYSITKIGDDVWKVECAYLDYWSYRIPMTTNDNIIRFNQKFNNLPIREEIEKMGWKKGDRIQINNIELVD